jgi:hypothetical protein
MGEEMSAVKSKVIPINAKEEPDIQNGVVLSVSSDEIVVNISEERVKAKKAFSCIVAPEPDDTVLCCKNETGVFYILGIIERQHTQNMTLSFPSDANLESEKGNLYIFSKDSVTVASENLNCFSKKAVHKSKAAIVSFDDVTATGTQLQASFKTVRLISNLINTMAKQVIDRFKGYVRNTEDNDQVKAGQLTRRAQGLLSMDSKHTIMVSKKSTKIDGDKILMG